MKKHNRTAYVVDGILTIKVNIDNSMDFSAAASSSTGGQYKKLIEKKYMKVCKSVWDPRVKAYYEKFRNYTNFPEFGKIY